MSINIALLRGINVSGQKMIKMTDLKRMFESMGFARVQTYIQSGNVVFESDEDADTLRRNIEQKIMLVFGFQVPVVVRTASELEQIVQGCPFDEDALQDGETLHVSLLADSPSQEGIDRLLACSSEVDEIRFTGREVYLFCRDSYHKTMFTNNFLEKKLGIQATTRNWRTTNILADMGKAMEGSQG